METSWKFTSAMFATGIWWRNWSPAASSVFHFAAQVAVTTSLVDPTGDFESNLPGDA